MSALFLRLLPATAHCYLLSATMMNPPNPQMLMCNAISGICSASSLFHDTQHVKEVQSGSSYHCLLNQYLPSRFSIHRSVSRWCRSANGRNEHALILFYRRFLSS
ncbi:uncharacterized protein EV420DRAFT_1137613 [Desarmillaria tabescens]|uniref:Secreted protein n=1 Tax=Armillaria tabescens TaxID=1929756 RepID=A0AA39MNC0_ARMTA|nr:uncharacterized protein EV420DRAFT_1137613 [Desarmillaria tabescens]KAK0440029.1 hypothetical protein EV420DRAFT_1137613 [Desarmillaria tabescens]